MTWPYDFTAEDERRAVIQQIIRSTPVPSAVARKHYGDDCVAFIRDNCITYDPRNPSKGLPARMPFIPFPKQIKLVGFIMGLMTDQEDGLIEKSRDMGATWICCAVSVWLWLYRDGSAVGWGSRKEQLVDKLGDPDSIFEKIRMIIRSLPEYCLPDGFNEKQHLAYMKCLNPTNDSTITGEAGDNIGRGGRSSIYFKDESAHYERPELIEASLGDNTNVQVDISSVCGEGTVFHRKRMSGTVKPFIMDWRDHPAKDQEWYDKRREKALAQGLAHVFAQEVDRDYAAAVEGVFIPSEWAKACIDAHIKLGIKPSGMRKAGQDVADEGGDMNALITIHGQVLTHIDQWVEGDTGVTAKRSWNHCLDAKIEELRYDSIGVGAGFKAKTNELADMEEFAHVTMKVIGWNAGGGVVNPDDEYADEKTNRDMFSGAKAQGMWRLRDLCHNTFMAVVEGKDIDPSQTISIPSDLPYMAELISEMSQPKRERDESGKVKVESKKKLKTRGIKSHNLLDALVMCVAPVEDNGFSDLLELALAANH